MSNLASITHANEKGADVGPVGVAVAPPGEVTMPALDAGNVVEEAELLLRESAPHDFDVLVLGGGPAGCAAALRSAQMGCHVGLVEEAELGGAYLNRSCVPAQILLQSARVLGLSRRAGTFGVAISGEVGADFPAMSARKREAVSRLREQLEKTLASNKVEVVPGRATFVGEHAVEVSGSDGSRRLNAVHIVIAVGSRPRKLDAPGADLPGVVNEEELLVREVMPDSLVTLADGGPAALELSYLFRALGSGSTLLTKTTSLLPKADAELARDTEEAFRANGLAISTGVEVERIEACGGLLKVVFSDGGAQKSVSAQTVLTCGREPNTFAMGLDEIGIRRQEGKIVVDEYCETTVAGVYAIGDCTRSPHDDSELGAAEGNLVAEHLARRPITVDPLFVATSYLTEPEIASAGLTAAEASKRGFAAATGKFYFRDNPSAVACGESTGWVKIVIDTDTERLLGCQVLGHGAAELVNQVLPALKAALTVDEFVSSAQAHPSRGEMLPAAALLARCGGALPPESQSTSRPK